MIKSVIKMKRLGLFALVLPFSKFAPAHAAPAAPTVLRARDLQCDRAQTLVETESPVSLATTFDSADAEIYVFDPDSCNGSRAERAYITTSDSPACLVGYRCESN